MTDSAPGWRATPRASPADTGEFHLDLAPPRSWVGRHRLAVALIGLGGVVVVAATLARLVVFQVFFVPSASMAPALDIADRIVVNRWDTTPDRGDIVVHVAPGEDGQFVRRVIAFGGETVSIADGVVIVDGVELVEPYLGPSVVNEDFEPFVVPEGSVFLLGDNRQAAYDSRLTGAVEVDAIVGTMVWRY